MVNAINVNIVIKIINKSNIFLFFDCCKITEGRGCGEKIVTGVIEQVGISIFGDESVYLGMFDK